MSQIIKTLTSGGPIPPIIPTSFVTQDGTAVPAANILIINADDSRENNTNGIITKGGVVGTGTANEVDIIITNRLQGTATTNGAVSTNLITFTPTNIGVYAIEYRTAAYNTTSLLGAGYSLFGAIRFDGVNSNLCDGFDPIDNEEGNMQNTEVDVVISGADVNLEVTGYVGQIINWSSVALYTFVGV